MTSSSRATQGTARRTSQTSHRDLPSKERVKALREENRDHPHPGRTRLPEPEPAQVRRDAVDHPCKEGDQVFAGQDTAGHQKAPWRTRTSPDREAQPDSSWLGQLSPARLRQAPFRGDGSFRLWGSAPLGQHRHPTKTNGWRRRKSLHRRRPGGRLLRAGSASGRRKPFREAPPHGPDKSSAISRSGEKQIPTTRNTPTTSRNAKSLRGG